VGRVAIIKPDHLGDLILASPAIRAFALAEQVVLHVGTSSRPLAQFLFPDMEIRSIDFPHLAREPVLPLNIADVANGLAAFDRVVILRDDDIMRSLAAAIGANAIVASGMHLTHDTLIHKRALLGLVPAYSRTNLFGPKPIFWPGGIGRVGLCIATGFPNNLWPVRHWYDLARRLHQQGIIFRLLGGPGEHQTLAMLSSMLKPIPHDVVEGSSQFADFLDRIEDLDLIVAGDGGTAHICSLRKPMLSLFGGSPWRRYAPFGFANLVMSRDLVCSPCLQFSTTEVNGCLTRECMTNITPKDVFRVVVSNGFDFSAVRQARVYRGASHLVA
jgi:hypothetical protein